jgi:glycerophosphoryl diester phosphodiesterase
LKDPEAVWGRLIQAGFTVLESDHPEALTAYLRGRRTLADRLKALRDPKSPHVLVIAHRGCWQDTAENSLAGLRLCDQVGVDMVEADVRRSKDGVLVMMHDATVDRTTSGAGRVDALTLAELRTLRLRRGGGGPDAPLIGETVSTFAEYMAAAKGRMLINLDPKAEVNAQAYEELKASGLLGQVLFKQAAAGEQDLAASAPFVLKAPFAMPITAGADPLDVVVQRLGNGPFAAVELSFTEPSRLAAATAATRKLGARAWLNTLRDPKLNGGYMDSAALTDPEGVWGYLLEAGVDAFQTDEPRALIRYLRTKSRW